MKYHCIESTWEYESFGYLYRIWRNQNKLEYGNYLDIKKVIDSAEINNINNIIETIAELPNINAIQVINISTRQGKMVYLVPF